MKKEDRTIESEREKDRKRKRKREKNRERHKDETKRYESYKRISCNKPLGGK